MSDRQTSYVLALPESVAKPVRYTSLGMRLRGLYQEIASYVVHLTLRVTGRPPELSAISATELPAVLLTRWL